MNVSKIYKHKTKNGQTFVQRMFEKPIYKDVVAVNNVSLNIKKGEFVGLVGNNGAGKSTLIKMMTGILYNTTGSIEVLGRNPYKSRIENNKHISAVFGQRTQLKWDLSPLDSFELLKVIYKIDNDAYNKNLNKFIEIFDMQNFIERPLRTLSLGQKMKCEITSAFLHNPSIVFLDEPTIGLDIFSKEAILQFLLEIKNTTDTTIILTTHDMNEIKAVCDRVVFLEKGTIIIDDSMDNLLELNGNNKNITIKTENKLCIKPCGYEQYDITVEDYKLTVNNINKDDVPNFIVDVVKNNNVKDIVIERESFDDIVRNVYNGRGDVN